MQRWADATTTIRAQSGFTLLELVIVIILVALLFLAAFWRLLPLRGDAEAAHVATTIGTLRSALGLEVSERIVKGSLKEAAGLEAANPMTLLAQAPFNYIGEYETTANPEIQAGNWYFHLGERQLRYRVRFPQYLDEESLDTPVEMSWEVRLGYRDRNQNGVFDVAVDSLRGITLESLDNPQWRDPDENIPEALEEP